MSNVKTPFNHTLKEFDLIYQYFHLPSLEQTIHLDNAQGASNEIGIGDDCALLTLLPDHLLAISTDTLVEGRHFFKDTDAADIAYKAFMVSVSDLAAMGATPKWLSLALTLPSLDEKWLARFSKQLFVLLNAYGIKLVGGDTTKGPLTLSFVVKGTVHYKDVLKRSGAQIGDDIYVTGQIGQSALGLAFMDKYLNLSKLDFSQLRHDFIHDFNPHLHIDSQTVNAGFDGFLAKDMTEMGFLGSYHFPHARIQTGLTLLGIAHSAMDISDGLASDLSHLCHASQVSADIDVNCLPLNPSFIPYFKTLYPNQSLDAAYRFAMSGGDDYELIFTAAKSKRAKIASLAAQNQLPLTRIGYVKEKTTAPEITYHLNGKPLSMHHTGFDHFS